MVEPVIATYRTLCSYADFKGQPATSNVIEVPVPLNDNNIGRVATDGNGGVIASPAAPQTMYTVATTTASGIPVTINIQLTLPETSDPKVYESFIKAMKDCFLSR